MSSNNFLVIEKTELFRDLYNFLIEIDESFDKQIYVDSYDFISIIVGADNIYKGSAKNIFDADKFKQKDVLVHSFIYHGYLDKPKLLNPHMFEFLGKIKPESTIMSKPLQLKDEAENIIYGLKLSNPDTNDERYRETKLQDLIPFNSVLNEAENRFKLMYLVDDKHPKRRASNLVRNNILSFETDSHFNLSDYTGTHLFKTLYRYLNDNEPDRSRNNFNDALALCQLQRKLDSTHEKISAKQSNVEIPVFFGREGSRILDTVEMILESGFILENGKKPFVYYGSTGEYQIVQTEDFFILDSLYNFKSSSKEYNFTFKEFLREIDEFHGNTLKKGKDSGRNQRKTRGEDFLNDNTKSAVHIEFFKKWWKDSDGERDLLNSLEQINGFSHDYLERVSLKYIDNEFQQLYEQTESSTRVQNLGLRFVRQAFHKEFMPSIAKKFNDTGNLKYNISQEFLTRFSYPLKSVEATKTFFQDLYESNKDQDKERNDLLKIDIITYLHYATESKVLMPERSVDGEKKLEKLCVMLSVLWIEEEYLFLRELCEEVRAVMIRCTNGEEFYPNYSIALLHAASILKVGKSESDKNHLNEIEQILSCISQKFSQNSYKAWIGQAFIYLKLWESIDRFITIPEIMIRKRSNIEKRKRRLEYSESTSQLSYKAIQLIESLGEKKLEKLIEREIRSYYATNLYIYIETLNRPLSRFPGDLIQIVEDFETNTIEAALHERYQDTLARFSQRMAAKTAIESPTEYTKFQGHLDQAILHCAASIEEAKKNNNKDLALFKALGNELHRINIDGISYFDYNRN